MKTRISFEVLLFANCDLVQLPENEKKIDNEDEDENEERALLDGLLLPYRSEKYAPYSRSQRINSISALHGGKDADGSTFGDSQGLFIL